MHHYYAYIIQCYLSLSCKLCTSIQNSMNTIQSHGYPWVPMKSHGYPWVPMSTHEYVRTLNLFKKAQYKCRSRIQLQLYQCTPADTTNQDNTTTALIYTFTSLRWVWWRGKWKTSCWITSGWIAGRGSISSRCGITPISSRRV